MRIENFYLKGIKVIIFLIPFLAIYISPSMLFPYITGKNFAFRILVELAAVLWLGLITVNRNYRIGNSPVVVCILIFTFIVGLADLLGVNPYNSLWSNYERMEGYITVLHLALYFMIVKGVLKSKKEWKILFFIFLLVSILVSWFALILPLDESTLSFRRFSVEYGTRAFGTIGSPPLLASYLLLSIITGIILFINTNRTSLHIVCVLSIAFNVVVIYLSGSRGAILAGAAGIVLGLLLILKGNNVSLKKLGIILIIFAVIAVSVIFLTYHYSDFLKHDKTVSRFARTFSDPSVKSRIDVWKMSINGVKERPILGWGQENFVGIYTANPIPREDMHKWLDRAHNIIIDWLVNAGFLGLFAYLAIFVSAFYVIWTACHKRTMRKIEANVLISALLVYFIQNLFIFDTINTYIVFFTLLAYIDNLESIGNPLNSHSKNNIDIKKIRVKSVSVTLLALMICTAAFYYLNYKPIRQCQSIMRISYSVSEREPFPVLLDNINNALSLNTFGNSYLRKIMMSLSDIILRGGFLKETGAVEFVQATTEQVMKGIAENRFNLEYMTEIIEWYFRIAPYEPAFIGASEALIRECMRLNPEYEWPYTAMTDIYILRKDYDSAYENAKKIASLDPNNDEKQLKLAKAAIYLSREDVVSSSLDKIKKIRMTGNKDIASGREAVFEIEELYQLVQGYRETKNFSKVLKYLEEISAILSNRVELNISRNFKLRKAKLHIEIAEVYQMLGDRDNAEKEVKKAAELDPVNFDDEAKAYID